MPRAPRQKPGLTWQLINGLDDLIAVIDPDGKIVAVNTAWNRYAVENGAHLSGVQAGANYLMVVRNAAQNLPDARRALDGVVGVLSGVRSRFEMEYSCEAPQSTSRYRMTVRPVTGGAIISYVDVSAQAEAQAAQKLNEQQYRRMVEAANDGIWSTDSQLRTQYVNQRMAGILGYTPQEMTGRVVESFIAPENLAEFRQQAEKLLGGESLRCEWCLLSKNGDPRWVRASTTALRDEQNHLSGVFATITDVSERRQADERLRFQASLLNAVDEAVVATGPDNKIIFWNQAARRLFGWEESEALDQPLAQMIRPVDEVPPGRNRMALLRAGEHWSSEFRVQYHEGRVFPVHVSETPILDQAGRMLGIVSTYTDISARRATEEALRASEGRFRAISDLVSDHAYSLSVSPEGRIEVEWASESLYRLVGGTSFVRVVESVLPEDRATFDERMARLTAGNTDVREYRIRTIQGQICWLRDYARPVWDPRLGRVTRLIGAAQDITARKQAEAALREVEARYHLLAENIQDVIWIYNLESHTFEYASPSSEKVSGFSMAELETMSLQDLAVPEDAERISAGLARRVEQFVRGDAGMRTVEAQMRCRRKDGGVIVLEVTSTLVEDSNGIPTHMVGLSRDITERLNAEVRAESEYQFRRALENAMPAGIIVVDEQGCQSYVNPAFCRMVGWEAQDLLGRQTPFPYWPEQDVPALQARFDRLLRGDLPMKNHEVRLKRRNGEIFPVLIISSIIRDREGNARGWLSAVQDASAMKEAEMQARAALAEKEVLLREVHHRVKNNLEVILALAEMQRRGMGDSVARASMQELESRVRTISLVHEDLYRAENIAQVRAAAFFGRLTGNLAQAFGMQEIQLELEVEDLPLDVDTAVPCGLIVNELITNIFKHAFPPGFATPARMRISLRHEDNLIELCVSDNGIGLPEGLVWKTSRSLGLRMVNRLTAQLHGDLRVESQNGTRFVLTFPLNRNPARAQADGVI